LALSAEALGVSAIDDALAAREIAKLRHAFQGSGYSAQTVREALGPEMGQSHLRLDTPLYRRRLDPTKPLHAQVQLFAMDAWLDEPDARAALRPLELESAAALGLIEGGPGSVRGLVRIAAHEGLWLAHDRHDDTGPALAPDHVLGVNPAMVTLASLTVRLPARTALDVGTGCGVQALLADRHSRQVVGVDINARALGFARINALLNASDGVSWLRGDMFAPVADRRFDLIVGNPPHVISPDSRYVFRDNGQPVDTLCERAVRRAARQLEDGGFATILCNWALRRGDEWGAPLERWVDGSGCDAWLLRSDVQDPLTYAAIWTRGRDGAAYAEALDRWTAACKQQGIEAIGMGGVILRRRSGRNWVRRAELPGNPTESCHDQILRVFRAHDFLSELGSARALLGRAFVLAPEHEIRQTLKGEQGRWVVQSSEVALSRGLRFRSSLDGYALRFFAGGDGRRTLGELVAELSAAAGQPNQLGDSAARAVQQMVALGIVVPAGATPEATGA
jgi:hypothetical protein